MTSTATDPKTPPTAQNSEVLALLNQILALPDQQRLALGTAWAAMDPSLGLDPLQGGGGEAQDGIVDSNAVAKLNSWMAEQQPLPPKERIGKLQAALDQENEEWARALLNAEIAKLKNAQPWLATEIAVMKYSYEHPYLMTIALVGLGMGLYRFGKSLLRVIF
ncbi:hypothetical protein [Polaromonas sp. JS666]|uniref:hypothetical protein n=1 Tax=Polaromonas sp. (strain JS666 / ATCC BAA-500) TaxID=296591 RepID=UPI0000534D3B|nr:hypothetical protein [Polaromonas sp. JS666]